MRNDLKFLASLAVIALVLVSASLMIDGFRRDAVVIALSFAMAAAAFDYASGFAGLRSLGPIVPFALGAYAHGVLMRHEVSFALSIVATPFAAAILGVALTRLLAGRRRDLSSWAVFGLAASIALEQIARALTWLTGGSNGILVARYFASGPMGIQFALLSIVLVVVCVWALRAFSRGPAGAAVLLAHFEPDRLEAHGRSVSAVRMRASALHWGVSGLAGVIFAATSGAVDPSLFGVQNNLTLLVACVLFGERTIWGPALAAFVIVFSENVLGSIWAGWQTMLLGVVLIAALLWRTRGSRNAVGVPR